MAFQLDGGTTDEGFYAETNLWNFNAAYTVVCGFYVDNFTAIRTIARMQLNTNNVDQVYIDTNGNLNVFASYGGSGGPIAGATALSTGTWYHLAMVRQSTSNLSIYLNGNATAEATATRSISGRGGMNYFYIGGTNFNAYNYVGRISHCRIWESALSNAEIVTECNSATAQKASPHRAYEFASGALTTDSSGNGFNLLQRGSPTFIANPGAICAAGASTLPVIMRQYIHRLGVT